MLLKTEWHKFSKKNSDELGLVGPRGGVRLHLWCRNVKKLLIIMKLYFFNKHFALMSNIKREMGTPCNNYWITANLDLFESFPQKYRHNFLSLFGAMNWVFWCYEVFLFSVWSYKVFLFSFWLLQIGQYRSTLCRSSVLLGCRRHCTAITKWQNLLKTW